MNPKPKVPRLTDPADDEDQAMCTQEPRSEIEGTSPGRRRPRSATRILISIPCSIAIGAAGCASVPDIRFIQDTEDGGGALLDGSAAASSPDDASSAVDGSAGVPSCPRIAPVGGVCCGATACPNCSQSNCGECAAAGCTNGLVCCLTTTGGKGNGALVRVVCKPTC
jgi:hypothetical protein